MKFDKSTIVFLAGAVGVFAVVQVLILLGILNPFWSTILRIAAVMAIASLGLNLIYGFNGQFSLGQWGFYALGAYSAADVTYRFSQLHNANGLTVLMMVVLFAAVGIILARMVINKIRGLDPLSALVVYLAATIALAYVGLQVGKLLAGPVTSLLVALPKAVGVQVVFIFAVLLGGIVAAEVSFLFGLPILTLGSDYFGIATLGFTIIIKVLLDNSDTMLGFDEMKGARGMIGIPKVTTWFWVAFFLIITIILVRNLLNSTYGRAIKSVREDELAAKAMGIDIANFKIMTFVIGSFLAGIAGALYAHVNGFLHPDTFNFIKSFDPMIIVVFGGLGSVTGTVVASFAWALVLEGFLRLWLPEGFETWRFVVYPILLLIMMLLKPNGIFGDIEIAFLKDLLPFKKKIKKNGLIEPGQNSSEVIP
jgi:branched-chain amino acid transport system permease protein